MVYFYIIKTDEWGKNRKYGITKCYNNRLTDSHEEHITLKEFTHLFKLSNNNKIYKYVDNFISILSRDHKLIKQIENIKNLNLKNLYLISDFLVNEGGGREFIEKEGVDILLNIVKNDFMKLGIKIIKEFTIEEIEEINVKRKKEYKKYINKYKKTKVKVFLDFISKLKVYIPRDYQKVIINEGIKFLLELLSIYIILPTGGGKSFIVYNIINKIKPNLVIIFSPRKNINIQNIGDKYTSILDDKYETHNLSGKNKDSINKVLVKKTNRIVVCCSQSFKKMYKCLTKKEIDISHNNTIVWFDEAHWGFEEWFNINNIKKYKTDKIKQYWFENKTFIKHRIFTSASPNSNILEKYNTKFGKIIDNIKVNQLIIDKWLCPLKSYIFDVDLNIEDVDILEIVLTEFKNNDKNQGFCFHNKQKNAFNLFYKHIYLFIRGKTNIKPFLLISEKYANKNINDEDTDEGDDIDILNIVKEGKKSKDPEIKEIIQKMEKLKKDLIDKNLNYDFQSEEDYRKSKIQIAYVVKKYSLGYDNKYIDFIACIDRKSSSQDITQTLGRGLRSDNLGDLGKNRDKELLVLIPIFIDQTDNQFELEYNKKSLLKIKEVLQYLLFDIKLDFNDLFIKSNKKQKSKKKKKKFNALRYEGTEEMRMQLLKLINTIPKMKTYPKIIELMQYNKINSKEKYLKFRENNKTFLLPENLKTMFKEFCWYNTYNDEEKKQFYTKKECIEKIKEIKNNSDIYNEDIEYEEDNDIINEFLNSIDNKIPNRCLDMFYGGTLEEYLVFN